jgi:hypothetical protein
MSKASKGDLLYFLEHESHAIVKRYLNDDGDVSFDELIEEIWSYFPKNSHGVDIMDAFGNVTHHLARSCPIVLLKALSDESLQADPIRCYIASALGVAESTEEIIDALSKAAKHKNAYLRCAAVRSLVKLNDKRNYDILRESLKDRNGMVAQVIWDEISDPDFFDYPYGIKALRRLLDDEEFKEYNYGEWLQYQGILRDLESRPHNARRRRRKPKPTPTTPGDPPCSSPSKKS